VVPAAEPRAREPPAAVPAPEAPRDARSLAAAARTHPPRRPAVPRPRGHPPADDEGVPALGRRLLTIRVDFDLFRTIPLMRRLVC